MHESTVRVYAMSATPDDASDATLGSGPSAGGRSLPRDEPRGNATDSNDEPNGSNRSALRDDRAQTDQLGAIVLGIGIAVVIGFVVLYLANEVMLMTNVSEGDPLYPAHEALTQATNNTFEMFGLLFIIALLSIAIIFLWRAQQGR